MEQSKFITSAQMAEELGISQAFAYKLIKQMNLDLKDKGYMVIAGKVSRKFYEQRFYGFEEVL